MEKDEIIKHHRLYLKEHEVSDYQIIKFEDDIKRKWKKNYQDKDYDEDINLIEIKSNEIVIEFDEKNKDKKNNIKSNPQQRDEWVKETEKNLINQNISFITYVHGGKCDHIHIKLNESTTKEVKEKIVLSFIPKEAENYVDLSLCGIHLVACPFAKHWKYKTYKLPVREHRGKTLLVEDFQTAILNDIPIVESSGITKEIVEKIRISDLAKDYGVKKGDSSNNWHCPFHEDNNPSFSINDSLGFSKCFADGCGEKGNIVDFVSKMENITIQTALNQLKNTAGIISKEDYSSAFKSDDGGALLTVNYLAMANIFWTRHKYFFDRKKIWWFWNKTVYKYDMVDEVDVMNLIDRELSWTATVDSKIKFKILEALKRIGRQHIPKEIKPTWIQFHNIIVDIETGENIEASPEFFVTNPLPWKQGASSATPIMDKLFSDWVLKENVLTLKEVLAFCALPSMPLHRIICLKGVGRNGKDTYFKVAIKLIGIYNTTSIDLPRIIYGRFETSKLYKKTMAFIGEIDDSIFKKTAILKSLSGESLMSGEFKGKDSFDFTNYAKTIIATNVLPETTDKTDGFYSRWCIIEFPNKFPDGINVLSQIPDYEYENFCNQIPELLKNLIKRGRFEKEGTVENRRENYELHSNSIQPFIKEFCKKDPNGKIPFDEFYREIYQYLVSREMRTRSEKEISNILKNQGYEKKVCGVEDELGNKTTKLHILGLKWVDET